jgi:hypothetical protein
MGSDVAKRIDWVEADLATWTPQRDEYDLVVCLYVHVAGSVEEMVQQMATGVARGGTLFLVGHRPLGGCEAIRPHQRHLHVRQGQSTASSATAGTERR